MIGASCESESLIENQKDFLRTFHHGQQHGHIGAGSDGNSNSGPVGLAGGAHLLSGAQYQDQPLVPQEQISGGHGVVGQIGQGSVLGGGPYVGAPVIPPYGGHKSDVQLHLGGARAISEYTSILLSMLRYFSIDLRLR